MAKSLSAVEIANMRVGEIADGQMVTAALVAIEALDDQGEPHLILMSDDDTTVWVHLGMAEAAAEMIRATMRRHR